MSALQPMPFAFNGAPIRTVELDGEPWFVAKDVCAVLEIVKVDRALSGLDADEKGAHSMRTPGGNQKLSMVSESGLYALAFKSRKPEAKAFCKWVTAEVLPSIRRTGAYGVQVTELQKAVAQLVHGQVALNDAMGRIADRFDATDARIATLEKRFEALEREVGEANFSLELPAPWKSQPAALDRPAVKRPPGEPDYVRHAGAYAQLRGYSRTAAQAWRASGLIAYVRDPRTEDGWLVDVAATDARRAAHGHGEVHRAVLPTALTDRDRKVFDVFTRLARVGGWVRGMKQTDLAALCGLTRDPFKLSVRRLVSAGYLESRFVPGNHPNEYRILQPLEPRLV